MNDDSYVFNSKSPTAYDLAARAPDRFNRFLEDVRDRRCLMCSSLVLVLTFDTCVGGAGGEHHVRSVCPLRWPLPPESCYLHDLVGIIGADGHGLVDVDRLERWEAAPGSGGTYLRVEAASGGRQPVGVPDWTAAQAAAPLEELVERLRAAARALHSTA